MCAGCWWLLWSKESKVYQKNSGHNIIQVAFGMVKARTANPASEPLNANMLQAHNLKLFPELQSIVQKYRAKAWLIIDH